MEIENRELTISAYIRPSQLLEPIDIKLQTLKSLETDGIIDTMVVHAWPDEIMLTEQTPYTEAIDTFERVEAWADHHGLGIRPPFAIRTKTSSITGETRTVLTTPMMCLTIHSGNRLTNVFPHSQGENQYSVTDAIAALRTGEIDLFDPVTESQMTPPAVCPDCETRFINVQGISVCQHCDRLETRTDYLQGDLAQEPPEQAKPMSEIDKHGNSRTKRRNATDER